MMEIDELLQTTEDLILGLCSEERGNKLTEFLHKLGETYFTAPASSKESYHNCKPSGLAEHNINVLRNLIQLNESFQLGFSDESMCVVALLHDIGKVKNTNLDDYYQPMTEKWKLDKGEKYEGVQGDVFLPTHQRSVWLCQQLGFALSPEEYQAILLNDGQYIQENKVYSMRECDLAKVLHMADMLAMIHEKKQGN